jgi:bifunctional non-homologous end joining protein LigD
VLGEHQLVGFPKTSGSRGIHINVPIAPHWEFDQVRRAALALAREMQRRLPDRATSAWWKEQRGQRILVDYNQNARDRTVASAYSVRPKPDAPVSCPLTWDEVPDVEPSDFTLASVPKRFQTMGDPGAGIDDDRGSLDSLLELAARDEASGMGDAPWPPQFAKRPGEATRVAPSRAKKER